MRIILNIISERIKTILKVLTIKRNIKPNQYIYKKKYITIAPISTRRFLAGNFVRLSITRIDKVNVHFSNRKISHTSPKKNLLVQKPTNTLGTFESSAVLGFCSPGTCLGRLVKNTARACRHTWRESGSRFARTKLLFKCCPVCLVCLKMLIECVQFGGGPGNRGVLERSRVLERKPRGEWNGEWAILLISVSDLSRCWWRLFYLVECWNLFRMAFWNGFLVGSENGKFC